MTFLTSRTHLARWPMGEQVSCSPHFIEFGIQVETSRMFGSCNYVELLSKNKNIDKCLYIYMLVAFCF